MDVTTESSLAARAQPRQRIRKAAPRLVSAELLEQWSGARSPQGVWMRSVTRGEPPVLWQLDEARYATSGLPRLERGEHRSVALAACLVAGLKGEARGMLLQLELRWPLVTQARHEFLCRFAALFELELGDTGACGAAGRLSLQLAVVEPTLVRLRGAAGAFEEAHEVLHVGGRSRAAVIELERCACEVRGHDHARALLAAIGSSPFHDALTAVAALHRLGGGVIVQLSLSANGAHAER